MTDAGFRFQETQIEEVTTMLRQMSKSGLASGRALHGEPRGAAEDEDIVPVVQRKCWYVPGVTALGQAPAAAPRRAPANTRQSSSCGSTRDGVTHVNLNETRELRVLLGPEEYVIRGKSLHLFMEWIFYNAEQDEGHAADPTATNPARTQHGGTSSGDSTASLESHDAVEVPTYGRTVSDVYPSPHPTHARDSSGGYQNPLQMTRLASAADAIKQSLPELVHRRDAISTDAGRPAERQRSLATALNLMGTSWSTPNLNADRSHTAHGIIAAHAAHAGAGKRPSYRGSTLPRLGQQPELELMCITAMPEYADLSLEELRWADYLDGNFGTGPYEYVDDRTAMADKSESKEELFELAPPPGMKSSQSSLPAIELVVAADLGVSSNAPNGDAPGAATQGCLRAEVPPPSAPPHESDDHQPMRARKHLAPEQAMPSLQKLAIHSLLGMPADRWASPRVRALLSQMQRPLLCHLWSLMVRQRRTEAQNLVAFCESVRRTPNPDTIDGAPCDCTAQDVAETGGCGAGCAWRVMTHMWLKNNARITGPMLHSAIEARRLPNGAMPPLYELNLEGCYRITMEDLAPLLVPGGPLSKLKALNLSFCSGLESHALRLIADACPDLRAITLQCTLSGRTTYTTSDLVYFVTQCVSLQCINFSGITAVNGTVLAALAARGDAGDPSNALLKLHINSCSPRLRADDVITIAQRFARHLRVLDARNTHLGTPAQMVQFQAELLGICDCLEEVGLPHLPYCRWQSRKSQAVCDVLGQWSSAVLFDMLDSNSPGTPPPCPDPRVREGLRACVTMRVVELYMHGVPQACPACKTVFTCRKDTSLERNRAGGYVCQSCNNIFSAAAITVAPFHASSPSPTQATQATEPTDDAPTTTPT